MDKKELKKTIRAEFEGQLKELGFFRKSESVYIRIHNNIIHNITFEFGSIGFTCAVALLPLYIKDYTSVTLHLTFGARLGRFRVVKEEWWSYECPKKGIKEIKKLLQKNGLPWFDRYGTPKGIVDFISNGKVAEYRLWINSFFQKQYLGFSLLYTGCIDEGIQVLGDMLGEISEDAVDYVKEYRFQMIQFIERIQKAPDDVGIILDEIVKDNMRDLKLPSSLQISHPDGN